MYYYNRIIDGDHPLQGVPPHQPPSLVDGGGGGKDTKKVVDMRPIDNLQQSWYPYYNHLLAYVLNEKIIRMGVNFRICFVY